MLQIKLNFKMDYLINYLNSLSNVDTFHFKIANLEIKLKKFKQREFSSKFENKFFQ